MGTTIFPRPAGGPFDDDGPSFPVSAGQGMGFETRLKESKKTPKQIIKEAEGVLKPKHTSAKPKMGKKPKNLRASGKKRKAGPFGEAYKAAPGSKGKGVRVSE